MGRVIAYIVGWAQGLALGWFIGMVVGSAVWYFRAKRTYGDAVLLEALDRATAWDTSDIDEA